MFVTNWISTTKIQKISEITNFFRHYFLSRTEVYHALSVVVLLMVGVPVMPVGGAQVAVTSLQVYLPLLCAVVIS